MSNKLKIILAIITSILVISGSAIIFNSQRRNSQTQLSKVDSSSSLSSTVSSNSSSKVSSVSVSSNSVESSSSSISIPSSEITKIDIPITSQVVASQTPVAEKPKSIVPVQSTVNPVVVPKVISPTNSCNLPQSPNLVRTDNGCFGVEFLYADSSIFKDSNLSANLNANKLDDNQQNRILLTHIATDYFKANKTKLLSKNYKIAFVDSIKLNNVFRLDVTFEDQEYNLKNKLIGIQPVCVKQYDINTLNNTYKFYQNNLNYPCL